MVPYQSPIRTTNRLEPLSRRSHSKGETVGVPTVGAASQPRPDDASVLSSVLLTAPTLSGYHSLEAMTAGSRPTNGKGVRRASTAESASTPRNALLEHRTQKVVTLEHRVSRKKAGLGQVIFPMVDEVVNPCASVANPSSHTVGTGRPAFLRQAVTRNPLRRLSGWWRASRGERQRRPARNTCLRASRDEQRE